MARSKRPRTRTVESGQILEERPVTRAREAPRRPSDPPEAPDVLKEGVPPLAPRTTPVPARSRPPVRERAKTGLYRAGARQVAAPAGAPADAKAAATRATPGGPAEPSPAGLVAHCPFGLFETDAAGTLLWVSLPFAEFCGRSSATLEGVAVGDTRLGVAWPSLAAALATSGPLRPPPTLKEILRFQDRQGLDLRFAAWLVPETDAEGRCVRYFGFLVPFPAE